MKKFVALAGLLVLGTSVSAAAPTGSAPSFAAARSYTTARWTDSVAIGDLDGNGKLAMTTANVNPNLPGGSRFLLWNRYTSATCLTQRSRRIEMRK